MACFIEDYGARLAGAVSVVTLLDIFHHKSALPHRHKGKLSFLSHSRRNYKSWTGELEDDYSIGIWAEVAFATLFARQPFTTAINCSGEKGWKR
jgi:hypothetical protein